MESIYKKECEMVSIQSFPEERDARLVATAKNGNRQAFEVFLARHDPMIRSVSRRYTRTREDAEDVMQQSFQKAFFRSHQFEGKSSFSTWLTRVAINQAPMLQRNTRSLRRVLIEDFDGRGQTGPALEVRMQVRIPKLSARSESGGRILSSAITMSKEHGEQSSFATLWKGL
jgi:RNA polymerase sigma factor (sigma-70 family)